MASNVLLHRVKKVRISETVVDQILDLIEDGKLKVGDQLPGERDLVNQLQVGRASVREALRILEAQGVIEVLPGKGTFVVGETAFEGDEGIVEWFKHHVSEELNYLEVRGVLDQQAAYLAAQRASEEALAAMTKLVDEAQASLEGGDLSNMVSLDRRFHVSIAEATGNEMLSHLLASIHEAMVKPRHSLIRIKGRAVVSVREHRAILDAIKRRDPEAAEAAVKVHNQSVLEAIKSLTDH